MLLPPIHNLGELGLQNTIFILQSAFATRLTPKAHLHHPTPMTDRAEGIAVAGGRARTGRTRRPWTPREEQVLIVALHDLLTLGWKADNGFRPGYGTKVYEVMKREIPNIQLKVNPHINSKVSTWKRDYHSLALILERSGVGFNSNGNHKIECNDEQWAQIVKADPRAKYMRHKPWPYWEDWKIIFGKDRGDGEAAEDICSADEALHTPIGSVADESQPELSPYHIDDFYTEDEIHEVLEHAAAAAEAPVGSDTKSVKSPASQKKGSRKRKAEDVLESMLEVMTKMHDDTSQSLKTLSARIGYDFDLSAKRVEVSKMLDDIPLITKKQKFIACDVLVKEPERLDLFMGFSLMDKADYIVHILQESEGIRYVG